MLNLELDKNYIHLDGVVDGSLQEKLNETITNKEILYYLDFDKVKDIKFSGIRAIINAFQSGFKLLIIEADDELAIKMRGAGLNFYVNVFEKEKELNLDDYEMFGAGFEGETYSSKDNDKIIKVYKGEKFRDTVYKEKNASMAIARMGLMVPLPGAIYKKDDIYALEYEKIQNKKSYARLLADDYANIKTYAKMFAQKIKELHSTPCDTNVFMSAKSIYSSILDSTKQFSKDEVKALKELLDTLDDTRTTCLHGDMHIGNLILANGESIFIDLPDFMYGHPYYDLGVMYFCFRFAPEELTMENFHITGDVFREFWDLFIREYLGTNDEDIIRREEAEITKYGVFRNVYIVDKMEITFPSIMEPFKVLGLFDRT